MVEIDAVTSATVRAKGKTADGSGHTTIKLSGIKNQKTLNAVAQAIFDVPGVVGVKVFDSKNKAMYDVESPVKPSDVAQAVKAAGAEVIKG